MITKEFLSLKIEVFVGVRLDHQWLSCDSGKSLWSKSCFGVLCAYLKDDIHYLYIMHQFHITSLKDSHGMSTKSKTSLPVLEFLHSKRMTLLKCSVFCWREPCQSSKSCLPYNCQYLGGFLLQRWSLDWQHRKPDSEQPFCSPKNYSDSIEV